MAFASSLRFRLLLDLVKYAIFAADDTSQYLQRTTRNARRMQVPAIGRPIHLHSQTRTLAGWFVAPSTPTTVSVLILHGLGDRIHYWRNAQQRLVESGIASLIFSYSGYGESEGATTPENLEADAHAAYAWLQRNVPAPPFLLGFSLGSGLAAQVAATLYPPPAGLILSQAFPSLREAARRIIRPLPFLARLLPDIWHTRDNVVSLPLPLLVIHSTGDALFPAVMAEELHATALGRKAATELKLFNGYPHNAPYRLVPEDYWAAIVGFIASNSKLE